MATRREKSRFWRVALGVDSGASSLRAFDSDASGHNGYSLALTIKDSVPGRAREISKQLFELGVNTDIHRYQQSYLVNFPMLRRFYNDARYEGDCRLDFPNATRIIDSLLVLPLHDQIDVEDILIASKRLLSLL